MAKAIKCNVCGCSFEQEDIIKFKRKNFCYGCFEENHSEEVVAQHYFYLTFQLLIGRQPREQEWVQCRRLLDNKQNTVPWTWAKLEKVLTYVYEVEGLIPTEEYGTIGILPHYEYQADKFYKQYYHICDLADELDTDIEEEHIYIKPFKEPSKEVELKSIDAILCWEEEE